MTLIKSISGIRGTIGGQPGEGVAPVGGARLPGRLMEIFGKTLFGLDCQIERPQVESQLTPEVSAPRPAAARPQTSAPVSSRSPQSGRDLPAPLSHR